jgi:hypothetical protein
VQPAAVTASATSRGAQTGSEQDPALQSSTVQQQLLQQQHEWQLGQVAKVGTDVGDDELIEELLNLCVA